MKPWIAALILGTAPMVTPCRAADVAGAPYPPFVIAHSELRVLPPSAHGRHYELAIGLPVSYATQPDRHYPVIYVTDGYWDFPTVQTS